jgi:hypothetical protein
MPQLDQQAYGSRAANVHGFGRRFNPASSNRRIVSDLVTPSASARASSASIIGAGNLKKRAERKMQLPPGSNRNPESRRPDHG